MYDVTRNNIFYVYVITSFLLCIAYSISFTPVLFGDSQAYINSAKFVLGYGGGDQGNRSPLYFIILAGLLKLTGEQDYLNITVYLQYAMIFFTSIFVFKIFEKIIENSKLLFVIGILFLFNMSTIAFGYLILTETLTTFLFVSITYMIVNIQAVKRENLYYASLGILTGMLILARYNTFFIPIWIILIIFIHQWIISQKKSASHLLKIITLYLIPTLVILNLWCIRNYKQFGFYFLFPTSGHSLCKNAVLVTLNDETKVSPKFVEVKRIFLNAKEQVLSAENTLPKGSLLKYSGTDFFQRIHSGHTIYCVARKNLYEYYQLYGDKEAKFKLSNELAPFYREVLNQNKLPLLAMRIYSLLLSFKADSTGFPSSISYNLNRLPQFIFSLYRVVFIFGMGLFLVLTCRHIFKSIKNKTFKTNWLSLTLICLIFYYPFINFLRATMLDAPRFKYPSEPLIFGLLVFYLHNLFKGSGLPSHSNRLNPNFRTPDIDGDSSEKSEQKVVI